MAEQPESMGGVTPGDALPIEEDLTGEPTAPIPETKAISPTHQDKIRGWLAFSFVVILGLIVAISFAVIVFAGESWDNVKELLDLVFPAITALIGSAVGFYFGSEHK